MSNQGDDCYFFFYSTCTKGDSCPFRHCEAAIGNEIVCNLWQEGRCFRQVCKYRHMAIDKKRSEIACYWENQAAGCQKGNCAFHHYKGRFVDGVFLPPSKTTLPKPEPAEMEPQVSQHQMAPNKLPVAPTPQLLGVKKMEATESVPSPTHPPVVINAADDDEDDDDQFSEEGEEIKNSGQQHLSPSSNQEVRVTSAKKTPTPKKAYFEGDNLNLGIKTIGEIKSKKHKLQECVQNDSKVVPNHVGPLPNETISETVLPVVRTVTFSNKADHSKIQLSLAQRLGKRSVSGCDSPLAVSEGECIPPVKKSLSERLGKNVVPPKGSHVARPTKVHRLLKDRLGVPAEKNSVETVPRLLKDRLGLPAQQNRDETEKTSNQTTDFRIKTLQEIRQEKAILKQELKEHLPKSENPCNIKQDATTKQPSALEIKTISEIKLQTRKRRMDGTQKDETNEEMKVMSPPIKQIRVKTLEEIRREKALRLQQQTVHTQKEQVTSSPPPPITRKRVLRIPKPPVIVDTIPTTEGPTELKECDFQAGPERNTVTSSVIVSMKPPAEEEHKLKRPTHQPDIETFPTNTMSMTSNVDKPKAEKLSEPEKIHGIPRVNVEPCVVKKYKPAKSAVKRKSKESLVVAAVKPLSPVSANSEDEQNQNKPSLILTEATLLEEPTVNKPSPKRLRESLDPPVPEASCPSTTLDSRRVSTASTGKLSLSAEDDLDSLIWEMSDEKLGDEIDLYSSKNEDDLLLELSEMIDN
ncbi:zinc finger CCCH domain-containing protein 11A isoform X1 [Pelobates fuscus]|uniref:zinc finger CCCH domain-containing protein 11A isoform X1 n=1 Tax=Pelobates fuscus TaxID=191477 RepID=UPI002FE4B8A4